MVSEHELFRQPSPGAWEVPIAHVADELTRLGEMLNVKANSSTRRPSVALPVLKSAMPISFHDWLTTFALDEFLHEHVTAVMTPNSPMRLRG